MSTNPYQSPAKAHEPDLAIRPEKGRGMAVSGLVLLVLGTLASSVVVIGLGKAFEILAATGQADPSELAASISSVMWVVLLGAGFTLVGGVLTAVSLYGQGNRERWFHALGMLVFVLQLGTIPLGPPIGIFLLFGGILRWKEFYPKAST